MPGLTVPTPPSYLTLVLILAVSSDCAFVPFSRLCHFLLKCGQDVLGTKICAKEAFSNVRVRGGEEGSILQPCDEISAFW